MQPHDVFRRQFDATVAALGRFAESLADVARVSMEATPDYWVLTLDPHAATACPLELVLHRAQVFDIAIGGESYDGRPSLALDAFEALLAAIVAGRVVLRVARSLVSGRIVRVTSVVAPGSAHEMQFAGMPTDAALAASPELEVITAERHFTPYRR
jgi:hypothetical protein